MTNKSEGTFKILHMPDYPFTAGLRGKKYFLSVRVCTHLSILPYSVSAVELIDLLIKSHLPHWRIWTEKSEYRVYKMMVPFRILSSVATHHKTTLHDIARQYRSTSLVVKHLLKFDHVIQPPSASSLLVRHHNTGGAAYFASKARPLCR